LRERKETAKIMAKLSKTNRKKKHGGNLNPGGFNIPTAISTQLCDFLGLEHGTLIPRTQVTKLVNAYILEHNLKNADNKKFIVPDQKLSQLLNMGSDNQEPLTYFNLQKYMKVHYLKKDEAGNLIPLVR
jgi:chromatin remodeling complex protein RSC6